MDERPAKLSAPSVQCIWECTSLSLSETVVWYRDWTLDNGKARGCYATPVQLARLLGGKLTAGTIETTRYRLKKFGLHLPVKEGAAVVGWICTLPARCPAPRTAKEATSAARLLEDLLRRMAILPDEEESRTQILPALNGHSTVIAQAPSKGGRGVPFSKLHEMQLPSAVSSLEKGVRSTNGTTEKRGARIFTAAELAEDFRTRHERLRRSVKADNDRT